MKVMAETKGLFDIVSEPPYIHIYINYDLKKLVSVLGSLKYQKFNEALRPKVVVSL